MLLAGGVLSCVTTSINITTPAMCKEPGMDGSDLMQGGKPGQPELVGCVVSSEGREAAQRSRARVLQARAHPRAALGTGSFREPSGLPVSLRDLAPGSQNTSPEQICDFLVWISRGSAQGPSSTPAFWRCALEGLQASSEGLFDNI